MNRLQRLLTDGDFSSTYKYALLLSFAELSVELGDDSGKPLVLPLQAIAEKFALYYWPQSAPFSSGTADAQIGVLAQNKGKQAGIVREILMLRSVAPTWFAARQHPQWPATLQAIADNIRAMPLKYLQNVGGDTIVFLYDPEVRLGTVRLLPGVACNLRFFQGFVHQLVRAGWVSYVRNNRLNMPLLGTVADLETFMFGTNRATLQGLMAPLAKIQEQRCFFCQERLGRASAVDHFIPWSRYPRDIGLNFVLTHSICNNDKRDFLAGEPHLVRWLDRNIRHGDSLAEEMVALGFKVDQNLISSVARWAYRQCADIGGNVWIARGQIVPISNHILELF